MCCQQLGAQEGVRDHGQDRWPHTLEHHAQYINQGEFAGRDQSLRGDSLAINQQAVRNCIEDHFFLLGFILFSFPLSLLLLLLLILLYFSY